MTAKFVDSFDHYGDPNLKWYTSYHADIVTRTGRFGTDGCSLEQDGYLMYYHPNLTTGWADSYVNGQTWIIGLAYRATLAESGPLIDFCLSPSIATSQVTIGVQSNGALYAASGSFTFLTTARTMTLGNWYYIEAQVTCDSMVGSATIHVNDTEWGTFSNVDTLRYDDTSYHYINAIQISGIGAPYIDDVYILAVNDNDPQGSGYNNTFWGDTRIEVMNPIGDGTRRDWTPSTGSFGWQMVDSAQPQYTDNVYAYATYQRETFNMSPDIALPGTMNAIQQFVLYRSVNWLEPLVYTSGSDYYLTSGSWREAFPATTSPTYGVAVWQRNPIALAQWDDTNAPASEFGFMSTTSSGSL